MAHQVLKQAELLGRQVHGLPTGPGLEPLEVDLCRPESAQARRGLLLPRPSQHRLDPRQELGHAEGLGDVVVGPQLQSQDPVGLLSSRRQHDDGRTRLVRAQGAAQVQAAHPGQHDVQNDQVHLLFRKKSQGALGIARGQDTVPLVLEVVGQTSSQ